MTKYGEAIATFTAKVAQLAGTVSDAQAYAQQVVQFLFPDVLTYDPQLPTSYGFAGRNGRALADDTADLILSLLANISFCDRVGKPDGFQTSFPYPAEPKFQCYRSDPAAVGAIAPIDNFKLEDFDRIFAINVQAVFVGSALDYITGTNLMIDDGFSA